MTASETTSRRALCGSDGALGGVLCSEDSKGSETAQATPTSTVPRGFLILDKRLSYIRKGTKYTKSECGIP